MLPERNVEDAPEWARWRPPDAISKETQTGSVIRAIF